MLRRRKVFLLLLISAVAAATGTANLRGRGQANSSPARAETTSRRHIPVEDYPVADYDAPESSDPAERGRRSARNRSHDLPDKSLRGARDFTLGEESDAISITQRPDHATPEQAIPAGQSDAIIVGEITGAKAYLSEDRSTVYSEFNVLPLEVLKDGGATRLAPNVPITAERPGGRVRLPSGKVLLRGFSHKGMPRVGRRYVLFLQLDAEGQSFSIVTGYELRGGRVYPLDGVPEDDYKLPQFAAYEGADEARFLSEVRAEAARSAQERGRQ